MRNVELEQARSELLTDQQSACVEPESAAAEEPNYKRVLDQLGKTEKKLRPRKRTTLSTYISFMFQNNIPQADVDRIIDIFFANKLISEISNRITYEF